MKKYSITTSQSPNGKVSVSHSIEMPTKGRDLKRLRALGKSWEKHRVARRRLTIQMNTSGHHETYEAVRYVRGLFTNIAVSAVYTHAGPRAGLVELQPLIFRALTKVIARHPPLSTVFVGAEEKSKPYYARLPHIDLRECVVFVPRKSGVAGAEWGDRDAEWDDLLEEYHNTRFDERWGELPLWRLVVLHDPGDASRFVACFVYLHPVGDGTSGKTFHRALLAALSSLGDPGQDNPGPVGAPDDPVVRCPEAPIPESLEALHRLPLSPGYLLKMAWYDRFPTGGDGKLWLAAPVGPPTRSRFRSLALPAETTRALLAAGRAHAVTLTATCHALIALAIFANLPPGKTRLKSSIAYNLRRILPPRGGAGVAEKEEEEKEEEEEEEVMGNYVSAPTLDLRRPAGSTDALSWAEARRVKRALDEEAGRNGKDASTACLRYVGDMHKYFGSKLGKPRDGTFCLTNLGVFDRRWGRHNSKNENKNNEDADAAAPAAATGLWRTERMIFSEGFDCSREAICVSMVTGEDGCLTVGLVWGEGVVEEPLMLGIYETLRTLLHKTAGEAT